MNLLKVFIVFFLFSTVSCRTQNKTVTEAFKKIPTPTLTNPYIDKFLNNIAGEYESIDGTPFTIGADGTFELGNAKFELNFPISEYQAVYTASNVLSDGKTLYTYHGLRLTPNGISTVPYLRPDFEKHEEVSLHDSPYAWEINTYRIENINWESGFTTPFAIRIDHKELKKNTSDPK